MIAEPIMLVHFSMILSYMTRTGPRLAGTSFAVVGKMEQPKMAGGGVEGSTGGEGGMGGRDGEVHECLRQ